MWSLKALEFYVGGSVQTLPAAQTSQHSHRRWVTSITTQPYGMPVNSPALCMSLMLAD